MEAAKRAASGLPPENSGGGANPLWMYVSGVLFALLLASLFTRKRRADSEEETVDASSRNNPEAH